MNFVISDWYGMVEECSCCCDAGKWLVEEVAVGEGKCFLGKTQVRWG